MIASPRERRRYPRFDFRIPVRYEKIEPTAQKFKGSLIKNISEGGVRMNTHEFFALNSRLAMEMPLTSGTQPVKGISRVAWVKKVAFNEQYDVGVEFINLNRENVIRINKFIFNKSIERGL